jgi:hypothetical protein
MSTLEKKLEKITKQLEKLEEIDVVSRKLDQVNSTVKNLETKIGDLKTQVENNHHYVEDRLLLVHKYVDNRFSSLRKAHEIIISGIPENTDHSLEDVFNLICSSLGYAVGDGDHSNDNSLASFVAPPAVKQFRLPGFNTFIYRFGSLLDKDEFLQKYYSVAKTLTLKKLGINDDNKTRVYLQPNLPADLYQVLKSAREKVKSGVLKKVKVDTYGDVLVKKNAKDRFFVVRCMDDLQNYLARNRED